MKKVFVDLNLKEAKTIVSAKLNALHLNLTPALINDLKRRDITYTLTPSVCSVDDGTLTSDGLGDHTGATFCADSSATG